MKKVFQNHSEVCHVWAQQTQETGNAGNISFERDIIYSYGWWPMAKIIGGIMLIRDYSYSSNTSSHINLVIYAVSHLDIIYVNDPTAAASQNVQDLIKDIHEHISLFKKAHSRKLCYLDEIKRYIHTIERLTSLFGKIMITDKGKRMKAVTWLKRFDIHRLESEYRRWYISYSDREAKREEKRQIIADKAKIELRELVQIIKLKYPNATKETCINRWRNFEYLPTIETDDLNSLVDLAKLIDHKNYSNIYKSHLNEVGIYFNLPYTCVRVNGDRIETSRGAYVPIREARILWQRMISGKDVKGFKVGHYTVTSYKNDELKVGCHTIPCEEISYIDDIFYD